MATNKPKRIRTHDGELRALAAIKGVATKKLQCIRTAAELKTAFATGVIDKRYWTTCVDSGGCYLRYVGPNPDDKQPTEPVDMSGFVTAPWELIEELMGMAGIPAERA